MHFYARTALSAGALLLVTLLLAACSRQAAEPEVAEPAIADVPAEFVGSAGCAGCHESEIERWRGSHHDLAMQEATPATVLGDFNDSEFQYYDVNSRFFTKGDEFWVATDNADGEIEDFRVRYTFGVTPLQQYLVEFPDGRLQPLLTAWDSRPEEAGGQRWFHLYPDEYIDHSDVLHWSGREQNWNFMCAECHSTRLEKNYELASDTFDTRWSEIDVACEACHGPASNHVMQANAGELDVDSGLLVDLNDSGNAVWQMNLAAGIAERSELKMSPQAQPEACGRCHSRRSISASDYAHGQPLLDTHLVSLLDENLYYPDGQIQGEVYVYGSFVQSKMYQVGVTCTDCHDAHSATLKTGSGENSTPSDVCDTCHLTTVFSTTEHHQHDTDDVECVDCHMPSQIYMGNDARRDHSFRIPRPDLTISTGSPNACNGCHADEDAAWADDAITSWYGEDRRRHFATAIHAGRTRAIGANSQLSAAATSVAYPGIARATALSLLWPPHSAEEMEALEQGLANSDPLLRIGALRALDQFPPEAQLEGALPLLSDPVRSVRIEAVRRVSPMRASLPQSMSAAFRDAEREYIDAQLAVAERPEALANLGSLFIEAGDSERALQFYKVALNREPRAVTIRVNLADLYRLQDDDTSAEALLREGLEIGESLAPIHHSLGLLLVRRGQPEEALDHFEQSSIIDPENPRYVFVYAIALNSLGQTDASIQLLQQAIERFPTDFDIGWSLVTMLRDQGRMDEARQQAVELTERFPGNENARSLLESLSAA